MSKFEDAKDAARVAGDAVFNGAQMAVAHKANVMLVQAWRKALGDSYPESLRDNEVVGYVEKLAIPFMILNLVEMYPHLVPQAEHVRRGAQLAIQAGTFEAGMPLLDKVAPLLKELANAGEEAAKLQIPDSAGVHEFTGVKAR